jgi:hypothetical protein
MYRSRSRACAIIVISPHLRATDEVCSYQADPLSLAAIGLRHAGFKVSTQMETVLYHMTTIAVGVVFLVLLLGLRSMLKGDSPNTSQKLMRWRVVLQFVAIVVIMAFVLINKFQG